MPTTKAKNLLYRIALPVMSPAAPADPVSAVHGHPLSDQKSFAAVLRRNHISGGAFFFRTGSGSASVFTRSFHTDLVPDEETFFRVASITKMATALLSVRLMDFGILDPDAPVSSLLPDGNKVPELNGILVRHLLSHTSGLSDPPGLEQLLIENKPYSLAVSGRRIGEPGESFRYSNLGYGLMGCVFESLLRKPVPEIYRDYLFGPLGMNATLEGCSLNPDRIMPVVRILPYRDSTGLRVTCLGRIPLSEPDPYRHYGHTAGSMYTDLPSLARLIVCIRDGGNPLLSAQFSGFMRRQVSSYGPVSPTLSYGSGLLLIRDNKISPGIVYGHQGFAYGCVDGAFWEEISGNILISLNGGCSEARIGRLGIANLDLCRFAFRKELPSWK